MIHIEISENNFPQEQILRADYLQYFKDFHIVHFFALFLLLSLMFSLSFFCPTYLSAAEVTISFHDFLALPLQSLPFKFSVTQYIQGICTVYMANTQFAASVVIVFIYWW